MAPKTVIAVASMAADLTEFDVSPIAETNTSANVAGRKPR